MRPFASEPPEKFAFSMWLFRRALGLVQLIAFLSLWQQLSGLLGSRGVWPVQAWIRWVGTTSLGNVLDVPSLAWLGASDAHLTAYAAIGTASSALLLFGFVPLPALLVSLVTYLSFVCVAGPFFALQWDALLIETSAFACFATPLAYRDSGAFAVPNGARWAIYWLLCRLMFASGVVKLSSGDETWRSLTALSYHYETQPLPTLFGWLAHRLPPIVHGASACAVFVIELVCPLLIPLGGRPRAVACIAFGALQVLIALTGNYGFFNLLTLALCIPLLPDSFVRRAFGRLTATSNRPPTSPLGTRIRYVPLCALLLMSVLAFVSTLTSRSALPRPAIALMSFVEPLRIVNGYGLFAVMTTSRDEIVFEASQDGRTWREYAFRHKPGDLNRAPTLSQPHMPRLDWLLWFAALGDPRANSWVTGFMVRLLEAEPAVLSLIDEPPFGRTPPRYVRALRYRYQFTDFDTLERDGRFWRRTFLGPYGPTLDRTRGR